MNRKAIIFGIKGYNLTLKERNIFKKYKPWGIILFSRNIKNISQLKNLVTDIKKTFKDSNYPILIDQEGGSVSRLSNIIDLSIFSQKYFANLYKKDRKLFLSIYKIYINKISNIFNYIGINVNTTPVLDVRRKYTHKIIGDRSFSSNPSLVAKLGQVCINLYKKNKIATVVKHVPGHGPAKSDTHFKKPIIKASKKELKKIDFKPFRECKSIFAMTCHAVYAAYDNKNTATHSKIIIQKVIRDYINFKGLVISDDISMKSLNYGLEQNAIKALNAGCNLVLHCNGNINQISKLLRVIPKIDKFTEKKTSYFYKFLR
tara:strand:- start:5092 stop:6039 length:948 start_codon:yes stop_codon:yes gene_type:complete